MLNFLNRLSGSPNPEHFFKTDHLHTDLKSRSVRSGAVTIAAQVSKFSLQTVGTLILARLLTPEDFGLIGMVAVILNFIELFKDLGLATATIQRPNINHAQVSTLFWINIALSGAITVLTAALSPAIARFYGEPRLLPIMIALALAFLLGGLPVQHRALLKRQMCFGALAIIEIVAMLSGTIAALVAAYWGAGYWSLVIWRLAQVIADALGAWIACGWRPGLPRRHCGVLSMIKFGSSITGFRTINYFSRNADNILIGRFQGAQALGVYSIAYRLLLMPIQQINAPVTNVALPTLSRLQDSPQKFASYYYKALLLITTISMPLICFLFSAADALVELLLGQQWLEAAPIFQLLAPAAFVGTINVSLGWAFISLGRVDKQLKQGIVASIVTVTGFVIGVQWGVMGVAAAYSITQPLVMLFSLIYCYQGTPLSLQHFLQWIRFPAISAITAAIAILIINHFLALSITASLHVLMDVAIYSALYIGVWMLTPSSRSVLKEVISAAKAIKRRKSFIK